MYFTALNMAVLSTQLVLQKTFSLDEEWTYIFHIVNMMVKTQKFDLHVPSCLGSNEVEPFSDPCFNYINIYQCYFHANGSNTENR